MVEVQVGGGCCPSTPILPSAPFLKGGTHKLVTKPPTGKGNAVPKHLHARVPEDLAEVSKIRKLAGSGHAPGDWILRARIISLSWQGLRTAKIAEELGCHPTRE